MKKIKVLLISLSFLTYSCSEKSVKKEISLSKENTQAVQIKYSVEKVDSLITYLPPDNGHKPRFKKMQKTYNLDDTFEGKYLELDGGYTYTKSATVNHRRMEFGNKYDMHGHVIKKLVQEYVNIQHQDDRSKKHTIQIFSKDIDKEMKTPTYKVVAYGNSLELHEEDGYFLATEYGCCTSTSTFHLLDLQGNSVIKTNDIIKSISTENNHYFISVLKLEVYDAPTIVIQNKNKERQYVSLSNFDNTMNYTENFLLKFKDENSPRTGFYNIHLANYHRKSLDDLEIWIPFGNADTLKIPFKNEKAFGVDYPQIKVTLQDQKKPAN